MLLLLIGLLLSRIAYHLKHIASYSEICSSYSFSKNYKFSIYHRSLLPIFSVLSAL